MAAVAALIMVRQVAAQTCESLAGRWAINRALSQFPREVGFSADWLPKTDTSTDALGGGGRMPGASAGFPSGRRVSEDDSRRVRALTAEVRTPPDVLTVDEAAGAFTIAPERGQPRTLRADGRDELLEIDGVPLHATARCDGGRLTILYRAEQGRDLRYTFSAATTPRRLTVDVEFVERRVTDTVRRVYDPAPPAALAAPPGSGTAAGGATPSGVGAPGEPRPAPSSAPPPPAFVPAVPGATPGFSQQPDAELKGLTRFGLVVEGPPAQPGACGVGQAAIENALTKRLTDAGFTVRRNSDDDTYVYVNVMTSTLPNGSCVSRFDAFLYSNTTATLSHQAAPVLIQVSLLHKGGMVAGAAAAHGEAVVKGLSDYIDQFTARIRAANR